MVEPLVRTLAGRLAEVSWTELDGEIRARARNALLDTLGAIIAGGRSDVLDRLQGGMDAMGDSGPVYAFSCGRAYRAGGAALVDGTAAHAWELDDFGGCGHSGAVVIPAVLAAAQMVDVRGADLLAAVVVGYEVAKRVTDAAGGYQAQVDRGWHTTSTCGSFGAAAGAARVLGLDPDRFAQALGIAGSFTGGIWAFIADGAMTKRLHAGKAAENGLVAAFLAREGVTGPQRVVEAEWGGFVQTYMGLEHDAQALAGGLDRIDKILQSGMKPYASCRGNHFPIDAVLSILHEHGLSTDDVESIVLEAPAQAERQLGNRTIRNPLDAQMSMPFGVAVALVHGNADLEHFLPERLDDEDVHAAMKRVELVVDPQMASSVRPRVRVGTVTGQRYDLHLQEALGGPERPLTDEQVRRKFASLASTVLPASRVRALQSVVADIESRERPLEDLLAAAVKERKV